MTANNVAATALGAFVLGAFFYWLIEPFVADVFRGHRLV